jgi:isocitrate dehydrogenase
VRENEEDLYAGIEYRISPDVTQCLKLITRRGTERIVRYAFEYARAHGRKRVTCFTKDNIMKITDGLFHRVYDEIGAEYPEIEKEHWIVDIGAAKLADTPEAFDVIVMPNLYGDILSDVAAQIAGSVGLAGSANIGARCAMFEAIHGSAPRRAGQNLANPSGLLLGSVMMLVHIGQPDIGERVHNAWLKTIEDGVHTYDVFVEGISRKKVGTREFAAAVVERLGQRPETLKPVAYGTSRTRTADPKNAPPPIVKRKEVVGVDVFVDWPYGTPDELGEKLRAASGGGLEPTMITSRGLKVWPDGFPETFTSDNFRCRFLAAAGTPSLTPRDIIALLERVTATGLVFGKIETLAIYDGEKGYTLGQGE